MMKARRIKLLCCAKNKQICEHLYEKKTKNVLAKSFRYAVACGAILFKVHKYTIDGTFINLILTSVFLCSGIANH